MPQPWGAVEGSRVTHRIRETDTAGRDGTVTISHATIGIGSGSRGAAGHQAQTGKGIPNERRPRGSQPYVWIAPVTPLEYTRAYETSAGVMVW